MASAQSMFTSIIRRSKGMESGETQRMFTMETSWCNEIWVTPMACLRVGVREWFARPTWVLVYILCGSGKLLNHSKPPIPHLCNGDNTTALTKLSGGLTEILSVIHLAQGLANNTLPVKGNCQCY